MRIGTREHDGATCELNFCKVLPAHMRNGVRELTSLWCPPELRGQGRASALLQQVCRDADERKMILVLVPDPYGDDPQVDKAALAEWYTKFNFHLLPGEGTELMARMYDPFHKRTPHEG